MLRPIICGHSVICNKTQLSGLCALQKAGEKQEGETGPSRLKVKPTASRGINPRSSDSCLDFANVKPLDFTGGDRGTNGTWTKWFRMIHLTVFLCAARQNRDGRPSDGTVGPSAAFGIADILNGTVGRITGHAKEEARSTSHPKSIPSRLGGILPEFILLEKRSNATSLPNGSLDAAGGSSVRKSLT